MGRPRAGAAVAVALAATGLWDAPAVADHHSCRDHQIQEVAQAALDRDPSGPDGLAGDEDGQACESLPRRGTSVPSRGTGLTWSRASPRAGSSCADLAFQEDAQAQLDSSPSGEGSLGADGDGTLCESLGGGGGTPTPTPGTPRRFSDTAGDTHADSIEAFAARGLGSGFPDGTYRPVLPVTRGQMASFLFRALGLSVASPPFTDVAGDLHEGAIGAIAAAGMTTGFADGTFRPNDPVTREQMASFLARAFDIPAGTVAFPDAAGVHGPAVSALATAGITVGFPDGTFRPEQRVTRGQMATFLLRGLALRARAPVPVGPSGPSKLAALRVAAPDTSVAYTREGWRHWLDADGDCQDTRDEVLTIESTVAVTLSADGCDVVAGRWVDIYTGQELRDPSLLDIDHMVPLADAHRSGGAAWSPQRRAAFANDMALADALVAVSASANRSKGDRSPDEWLPPASASHCRYATAWVDVKHQWALTVTPAERVALESLLSSC